MNITEIEDRVNELVKASKSRVEEIVSLLEEELSSRETEFAAGNGGAAESADGTYPYDDVPECKYIPMARELLKKIKRLNQAGLVLKDTVSALKLTFVQIYDNRPLSSLEPPS